MMRWLGVTLWMTLILYNSSIPALPNPNPTLLSFLVTKAGHVVEYAVLGWAFSRTLVASTAGFGLERRFALALTIAVGVCFAALDEARQLFVYSRTGYAGDVALDAVSLVAGAVIGVGSLGLGTRRRPSTDQIQRRHANRKRRGEERRGEGQHDQVHGENLAVSVDVGQERHHGDEMDGHERVKEPGSRRPSGWH